MSAMPTRSMSNVVSLNGLGPNRSPGLRILTECRDQLINSLSLWLHEIAAPISEELFVLADSTRERLLQTRYLDLRADIEKDWSHLVETFRRNLASEAERCQNGSNTSITTRETPLEIPDFEGLTLVDDGDLSEHIVIREFAAQIAETCDEELYTLNRRVAALLGHDELAENSNPLAPKIICQALSDACSAIGSDAENRLLLLRRIERHLHRGLPPIYQQINTSLIERGILPELKRSYRKSDIFGEARASASPTASAGGSTSLPSTAAGQMINTPAIPSNILETLQRLASSRPSPSLTPPGQSLPGSGIAPSGTTGMIAGGTVGNVDLDINAINNMLMNSLGEMQHVAGPIGNAPIVNQVRLVRESDNAKQAGGMTAVTIDIVAMLFDFIFDDDHIPVAIKALLSRLQIPVLKVAMLNPGFFADRSHPTRRFLGGVSGISIRWGGSVEENDPFYVKLAELVERIQTEFENDVEIFGTALSELEAFVDEREKEETAGTQAVARIILQREHAAEALDRARRTTIDFCAAKSLPPVVTAFLNDHWAMVLQAAELTGDEKKTERQAAEQTMRDLAWSIEAKKTPDDRLKLIGLLPKLLGQINKGLDCINIDSALRQRFFDELVKHHSAALKGEIRPAATEAEASALPPPAKTEFDFTPAGDGDLQITCSADDGIEVEEITLVGANPVWRADDREIFRRVSELRRGDWIEFRDPSGEGKTLPYRERLHWISPQRGILLFSNHRSASAISITPEALARQIRDGLAAIVAPEEIFEKALNGALESINAL